VRDKLIRRLADKNSIAGYSNTADALGVSEGRVSTVVRDLEKEGLVRVRDDGEPYIVELTAAGKDQALDLMTGGIGCCGGKTSSGNDVFRLHRARIGFPVAEGVSDDAIESFLKDKCGGYRYVSKNDVHIAYKDDREVRVTADFMYVRLENIRGPCPHICKDRMMRRAWEVLEWIEDWQGGRVPVRRSVGDIEVQVSEQHIAKEEDVLVDAVREVVRDRPDLSPGDFRVRNEDGEMYRIDGSTGWELESIDSSMAEEYMGAWEDFLEVTGSVRPSKKQWRDLMTLDVDSIEDQLERIGDLVGMLVGGTVHKKQLRGGRTAPNDGGEDGLSDRGTDHPPLSDEQMGKNEGGAEYSGGTGPDGEYYDEEMRRALDRAGLE